jgi:Cellulose biosynthesis protein BcsS
MMAASLLSGLMIPTMFPSAFPLAARAQDSVRAGTHNSSSQHNHARNGPNAASDDAPEDIWAWRETWSGAEQFGRTVSVYSGATVAVGGSILRESGWRLRSISGHGRASYPGVQWIGGHAVPVTVHARNNFSDLLAGYQWGEVTRFGHLTIKAFSGLTIESQHATPGNAVAARGLKYGGKAAVEGWLDLSDRTWLSVDASLGSARRTFSGRSRYGWRMIPGLSIGPEVAVGGNEGTGAGRAGAFARFEWGAGDWWSGEVSAAGGVSTNTVGINDVGTTPISRGDPYANVSLLLRY